MELLSTAVRLVTAGVFRLWKSMFSLRASGTSFDPEIINQKNNIYHVAITVYPGIDEVEFLSLRASGCDLAPAAETFQAEPYFVLPVSVYQPEKFRHESIPVNWIIPPAKRSKEPLVFHVFVKPAADQHRIKFTLSGGWLNQLTATRSLSAFE